MISGVNIKKAIIEVVKNEFKNKYKFLQNEVEEDFSKPSFFLSIISDISETLTINITRKFFDVKLKVYGLSQNEMVEMSHKLQRLFNLNLKVWDEDFQKNRYLLLQHKASYIEEYEKYMEFSFSIDFMDKTRILTEEDTTIDYTKNVEEVEEEKFELIENIEIDFRNKED